MVIHVPIITLIIIIKNYNDTLCDNIVTAIINRNKKHSSDIANYSVHTMSKLLLSSDISYSTHLFYCLISCYIFAIVAFLSSILL